jgi:hypothetical protein
MSDRFIALKDNDDHNDCHEVMAALDKVGIEYEYYSYDDVWSVLMIKGTTPRHVSERSFEGAISYVGADEE